MKYYQAAGYLTPSPGDPRAELKGSLQRRRLLIPRAEKLRGDFSLFRFPLCRLDNRLPVRRGKCNFECICNQGTAAVVKGRSVRLLLIRGSRESGRLGRCTGCGVWDSFVQVRLGRGNDRSIGCQWQVTGGWFKKASN